MTEKCFEERFRDVEENYKVITNRIAEAAVRSGRKPEDVTFLTATKTVPAEVINHAIGCGLRFIGENRVQEFMDKYEKIDWDKGVSGQIIGRLQTNKVKYIIDKVDCIQSVDSVKLAKEISRLAEKIGRKMPVLIEVNIGGEESNGGIEKAALPELLEEIAVLPGIQVNAVHVFQRHGKAVEFRLYHIHRVGFCGRCEGAWKLRDALREYGKPCVVPVLQIGFD